jgi:MbtH protein
LRRWFAAETTRAKQRPSNVRSERGHIVNSDESEDIIEYQVVINDEEQYSIWPTFRQIPPGWHATGPRGSKQLCLDYIESVWTDMRPLSLRKALADQTRG